MKSIVSVLILLLSMSVSCGDGIEPNRVPIDQINNDKSNNYRFIFRDEIRKDSLNKLKEKKGESVWK